MFRSKHSTAPEPAEQELPAAREPQKPEPPAPPQKVPQQPEPAREPQSSEPETELPSGKETLKESQTHSASEKN